ncbi:DNA replication complex GINS SLD5 [Brachionus plicatilis]|uniref:DNA replication complex GINS protein SLD5 n=1 Tax=Brachionus plicatilis TaxID=10195 RepID=A0A3M7QC88_BRAPC|nr:DNA replication complex GINS SLD5 [Brachionus plicatilis]
MESQYSSVLSSIRPINTDESSSLSSNTNEEEYTHHQAATGVFSSNHSNGAEHFDEDDEEEEITPAELIEKLQQSWLNEKFSPELLEHKTPVVECIIEQIKHMENNIRSAKKGDFRIAIHKLELDRIKYMLYSYLRIRIKKIEQFASSILEEDVRRHSNIRSKLSAEEFAYASEYLKNVRAHLTSSVLEHLPSNLQDLNEAVATVPRPDMDKFVFLKTMDSIKGILIDDMTNDGRNEIIDMDKDDLYIMRYNPIKSYVNSGEIQLI